MQKLQSRNAVQMAYVAGDPPAALARRAAKTAPHNRPVAQQVRVQGRPGPEGKVSPGGAAASSK
jgi:hypothetical protein